MGLAELVRNKEVTPLELVEAALLRIEQQNSQLHAVIHLAADRARSAQANEGKFAGVPFLIKDLVAMVAGVPQTNGSAIVSW